MNYNERTREFEKTTSERVGFVLGYVGWWAFKTAFLLAVGVEVPERVDGREIA